MFSIIGTTVAVYRALGVANVQCEPTFLMSVAGKHVSSTFAKGLGVNLILNAFGVIVTPAFPSREGSGAPSGSEMSKLCKILAKNKKSSILASTSPKHILRPTPKGMKNSGFFILPLASTNLSGLNCSGLSQRVGSMWTLLIKGTT